MLCAGHDIENIWKSKLAGTHHNTCDTQRKLDILTNSSIATLSLLYMVLCVSFEMICVSNMSSPAGQSAFLLKMIMQGILFVLFSVNVHNILKKRISDISEHHILFAGIVSVGSVVIDMVFDGISAKDAVPIICFWICISYQMIVEPRHSANTRQILRFSYMFWIFVIASVAGLIMETVYKMIAFGVLEDRSGMLFGPFSPIYGIGALFMTIATVKVKDKGLLVTFFTSAIVGALIEFFVSWYMESSFGIIAWDYSDKILNVGGRTDIAHSIAWGFCGLFWIKVVIPEILRLIGKIPERTFKIMSVVAFSLLLSDAVMTLIALDCWSDRIAGVSGEDPISAFFASCFDDVYMENRFQTMGMERHL